MNQNSIGINNRIYFNISVEMECQPGKSIILILKYKTFSKQTTNDKQNTNEFVN